MMVDLNLRQVQYLLAVIDEGHFGRAARRLFISSPALTQQIRKLEQTLGTRLIDRSAHPLQPTAAGERFLAEARVAHAAAQRAVDAVTSTADRVRIGFMTAAIQTQGRALINVLRRGNPRWPIDLVELAWSERASAVREGKVDASLMRPPVGDASGLRFDVLCTEGRVVALPSNHCLTQRQSVAISELDDESHVTDDQADREWVKWWACDPRPSGKKVMYGTSVHTIDELLEAVASERNIAITGELVPESHRHPGVVFVPVRDVEPSTLCLCTRDTDTSAKTEAVRLAAASVGRGRYAESSGPAGQS